MKIDKTVGARADGEARPRVRSRSGVRIPGWEPERVG